MARPGPKPKRPKRGKKPAPRGEQDFLESWKRLNPDPPRLPDELVRPPGKPK